MLVTEEGEGQYEFIWDIAVPNPLGATDSRDACTVNFGLLVWSTGLAPNPLIDSITEAKKDERTKR